MLQNPFCICLKLFNAHKWSQYRVHGHDYSSNCFCVCAGCYDAVVYCDILQYGLSWLQAAKVKWKATDRARTVLGSCIWLHLLY